MSGRASAARYARALLDVSIKEADPVRVGDELSRFADLVDQHADLRETLKNPRVSTLAKRNVIAGLSERLTLSSPLSKLLAMLADRDRLPLVSDLNEVYQERLREHLQILQAEVTTATPIDAAYASTLLERLQAATGRRVTMTTRVDPALIGGLVARIGSTVYDGSVATRLAKLREQLLHER
jgi:F-type H+-transporting ATPase subunit delta